MKSSGRGSKPSRSRKQSSGGSSSSRSRTAGRQQEVASGAGRQYGEGNYAATRQYNTGLKHHVENSDIEREARDAEPRNLGEANEMREAEREGRGRSKGGVEATRAGSPRGDEDIER